MKTTFNSAVLTFFALFIFLAPLFHATNAIETGWEIDLFNQWGGRGKNVYGAPVSLGERIILFAYVTYNKVPVQSVLTSFQVLDPRNYTIIVSTTQTNSSGYAKINFTITANVYPHYPSLWRSIASASPTQETVVDTMSFYILLSVGGISVSIQKTILNNPSIVQILMITAVMSIRLLKKHKAKRVS